MGEDVKQLPSEGDPSLIVSGEHSYAPGQFLTAAPESGAPEGFLLKVVSSKAAGGDTEVETEPGSLYEAVPNGEVDADFGNLGSAKAVNADARAFSRAVKRSASGAKTSALDGGDVPFSQDVVCEDSAEMKLTGHISAEFGPHFELKWHKFWGVPIGIDKAKAMLDASAKATAIAGVSAGAGCHLDETTIFDPVWETVLDVGGVPVPAEISVPFKISGSASVTGVMSVEATASASGSVGVEYHDDELSGIHELSSDAALTHADEANATLQAKLGPTVEINVGWSVPDLGSLAATAEIGVFSGLNLNYETATEPPGSLCAPLDIEGKIGLDLVFKKIDKSVNVYKGNIKCIHWGESPGLHWTGTVTYNEEDHWNNWDGEGSTYDDVTSATWQVDAHTNEGFSGSGPMDYSFEKLDYTDSSWHQHSEYAQFLTCAPYSVHHARTVYDGGGSGPPNELGDTRFEELSMYWTPTDYGFAHLETPYGSGTLSTYDDDCEGGGGNEEVIFNDGTGGICGGGPAATPLPHSGTQVVGEVSGNELCTPESVSTSWSVSYNLTVTCPGGFAPNAEWMCPEP